jgi:hypothetical protein
MAALQNAVGQVRGEIGRGNADGIRNPDVGEFALLTEPVRNGPAHAEPRSDLLHREERLDAVVLKSWRFAAGDTGATNLASQAIARRGLSILARMSPFGISKACDARKSRLTRENCPSAVRDQGVAGSNPVSPTN